MKILKTTDGYETKVDDDIAHIFERRRLNTYSDKRPDVRYVRCWDLDRKISTGLSRYILSAPKGVMVDHINGDTLDNRRENLRLCTNQQNQANSRKQRAKTHSKYKGVTHIDYRPNLTKKWQAGIYYNGRSVYLGNYACEEDAALAYNFTALQYFGDFAHLNEVVR